MTLTCHLKFSGELMFEDYLLAFLAKTSHHKIKSKHLKTEHMAYSNNYKAYTVINYFVTKLCSDLEILRHLSSLMECNRSISIWGFIMYL